MSKDRFVRSEGELVTTKEDQNYNITDKRGDDGEVKVEGQDRYLWPTTMGAWNDKAEVPNEKAAKEFIETDSAEKEEAKAEAKSEKSDESEENSTDETETGKADESSDESDSDSETESNEEKEDA